MNLEKMKALLSRLLNLKKTDYIAILLIAAMALIVMVPIKEEKKGEEKINQDKDIEASRTDITYEQSLEKKLENILKNIDGVGKVRVMITLSDDGEKNIDKDVKESTEYVEKTTVIYENDDGGQPYIVSKKKPQIEGVLVVAEGGGQPQVNNDISSAIQALFDVEMHKIKVAKMLS